MLAAIVGFVAFVQLGHHKTYDAPLPNITAASDSATIARGKYLAFGPAHCATCHIPFEKFGDMEAGVEMPLIGGLEFDIPPGKFRSPNLTPHPESGIGNMTDQELARALRYNVKRDHTCLFPFMPFNGLSDDDLMAVISFLRAQPAVEHTVPRSELTFLGKALMAFGAIKPDFPVETPPVRVAVAPTPEYGKYLAQNVANCYGCHTNRDMKTGAFIGEPYAGGMYFEPDKLSQGYGFVTPNLTPHEGTGVMARWDEATFIKRMKSGRVHKGSHMPWGAFSRMDTTDLRAIYAYLRTVKPVENAIAQVVFAPGERPEAP